MTRRSFIKTGLIFVPTVASAAIVIQSPSARFNAAPGVIDPTYFPNLKAWWKADSYSLSDMATVFDSGHEWTDQTGNGYDWANVSNYPVFRTGQINGLPAIQFSGSEAGAITPISLPCCDSPGMCIIAVTTNVTGGALLSYPDGTNSFSMGDSGNVIAIHGDSNVLSSSFSTALSDPRVNVWRAETGASHNIYFYEGATARGSSSAGNEVYSFFVMGSDGTIYQPNFTGMVSEMVVYDADLSPTNIASLYTNYFQPRYAL